jgi:hypothetical protein
MSLALTLGERVGEGEPFPQNGRLVVFPLRVLDSVELLNQFLMKTYE